MAINSEAHNLNGPSWPEGNALEEWRSPTHPRHPLSRPFLSTPTNSFCLTRTRSPLDVPGKIRADNHDSQTTQAPTAKREKPTPVCAARSVPLHKRSKSSNHSTLNMHQRGYISSTHTYKIQIPHHSEQLTIQNGTATGHSPSKWVCRCTGKHFANPPVSL